VADSCLERKKAPAAESNQLTDTYKNKISVLFFGT
jgi:hypothetical protein